MIVGSRYEILVLGGALVWLSCGRSREKNYNVPAAWAEFGILVD